MFKRSLALVLVLLIMCSSAMAHVGPVTRSDFVMQFNLSPESFPKEQQEQAEDWNEFLNKITLQGVVDVQNFPNLLDRVYFNGGLTLNKKMSFPFEYDGYFTFRYIRSPFLGGKSIFFQMYNWLEFMLKPYYYEDLPTNLVALPLFPEATQFMIDTYYTPLKTLFAGEGERHISHAELNNVAEAMSLESTDDILRRVNYYVKSLLAQAGISDDVNDTLSNLSNYLVFLDPMGKGVVITPTQNGEEYKLGNYEVFSNYRTETENGFKLFLPTENDFEVHANYSYIKKEIGADAKLTFIVGLHNEERVKIELNATGLPKDEELTANGEVALSITGTHFIEEIPPISIEFAFEKDAAKLPFGMKLDLRLCHPQTNEPAFNYHYSAQRESLPPETMVERPYDNQDDFFNLNEKMVEEHKEKFALPLLSGFLPFVLEMPGSVINDIYNFATETNLLSIMGMD